MIATWQKKLAAIVGLLVAIPAGAESSAPDPLTARGIDPGILEVMVSSLSQNEGD